MVEINENGKNYGLRDEIKAYWSARAATFDLSPGHEIFSEDEREAWRRLVLKHLGKGEGRAALDLASGTGVISHLMDELGYLVTGLDWAEPMLERAKAKARQRERSISFRLGDAENTMEKDDTYDVIVTRHLVWTLVDPKAAFAEWLRVLKPGGRLLIIDGDFVNVGLAEKLLKRLADRLQKLGLLKPDPMHAPAELVEAHNSIVSRIYFAEGARAGAVATMLHDSGFKGVTIDTDLRSIHRTQARHWNVLKGLARSIQHRYAISAKKPV
jgi:ubiquinone/menaquinone biosynthesis C-methylase UbiE